MPTNRNAQLRYQVLDRCFSNRRRNFFWQDLLHEINNALEDYNGHGSQIKRRQLFEDIKYMESDQGWSIPLNRLKDGRRVYYRYSDPEFTISKAPINEEELNQINAAIEVLSRFGGAPQFEWVQELIPVLKDRFDVKTNSKEIISIESNVDLKGIEHLSPLYEAINKEQVLSISYKDFKTDESYSFRLHPHFLKQYNNRWFVIGLNTDQETPSWTVALDRILSIEYSTDSYQSSEINWNDYFYDIIGVTRPADIEVKTIKLEVTKEQAPYIETKPLHPTQKSYWTEDKLIVEIEVIPNYELETLILSFGEKVKVLEPYSLLHKIRTRVRNLNSIYDENH